MGRGSDLFRYSGMANPDITSGANMILSGLGTPGELADKATAKQRVEMQDLRQAKADALATPGTPEWLAAKEAEKELKMGLVAAEHNWKMENDKGYRATIPGTEEYELARQNKLSDETAIINARSAADAARDAANPATKILQAKYAQEEKILKGQEVLANAFANIPENNEIIVTTTTEQVDKARTGLESAAVTSAGDVYNKEFTRLTKPETRLDVDANGEVILVNTAPAISPEGAHQKAMEKAKLLDLVAGNAPVINESMLPKAGTVKTEKAKTPEELTQAKLDVGVDLVKKGLVPATTFMDVANKLNPVNTPEQILARDKYLLDVKKVDADIAKIKNDVGGKGAWEKDLEGMFTKHGEPDFLIGSGQRAEIEGMLINLQVQNNASDTDVSKAIKLSEEVYANIGLPGVDENGFKKAVEKNLLKILRDKKAKEIPSK